jgi:hypothetical protein
LHATVLLAVKYSAELNKYILLVKVICGKYRGTLFSKKCINSGTNPKIK